jgi:hypothetical protein
VTDRPQETSRIVSMAALYSSVALVQSKFALLAHAELPAGTDVDALADEVATELMCLSATIERIEHAAATQVCPRLPPSGHRSQFLVLT